MYQKKVQDCIKKCGVTVCARIGKAMSRGVRKDINKRRRRKRIPSKEEGVSSCENKFYEYGRITKSLCLSTL